MNLPKTKYEITKPLLDKIDILKNTLKLLYDVFEERQYLTQEEYAIMKQTKYILDKFQFDDDKTLE